MVGFHRGKGHALDQKTRRKVVMLRDKYGMSFPTIAERLGCTSSTASTIYHEEKKMETQNHETRTCQGGCEPR